jgi:hypothetical protein
MIRMKKIIFLALTISYLSVSFGQIKKEYQDPAIWIDLELKEEGIPVKITSISGEVSYFKAPIKLVPKNTNKFVPLQISIDSIKYEAIDRKREIVMIDGKIDLTCCKNKPVNMELYDKEDNFIQFATTDNNGNFKLKSINGNILEIKNNRLKLNFKRLKTIDVGLDERFVTIERFKIPSQKKIKRLRKKEKLRIQDY